MIFIFPVCRYPTDNCIGLPSSPTPTPTLPSPSISIIPTPTIAPVSANNTCLPENMTFFTDDAKVFAVGWIATWSAICFCSTLITILTFAISTKRFEYPWRPIVYLAICFNIHSIGHFLSLMIGRNIIACPGNQYVSSTISWGWQHVPCLLVFTILYYTMMAAFLWWLVLTVGWFLAAGLKWSSEGIGNLAPLFHIISWVVPLGMI